MSRVIGVDVDASRVGGVGAGSPAGGVDGMAGGKERSGEGLRVGGRPPVRADGAAESPAQVASLWA
jgi:hypothetical protein